VTRGHASVLCDRTTSEITRFNRTCTQTLLSLVELLKESEVSWDFSRHGEHRAMIFSLCTSLINERRQRDVAGGAWSRGR
jgi:hypothetical protein